jgi:hypothetical protein
MDRMSQSSKLWLQGLTLPESCIRDLPLDQGHRLQCTACFRDHVDIGPAQRDSGLSGEIRSVNLRDRLSISVYAVRRGISFDYIRAAGRSASYDCLACLLYYYFHRSFIIVFLFYASVIHMRDKAARGKSTIVLGDTGYRLLPH